MSSDTPIAQTTAPVSEPETYYSQRASTLDELDGFKANMRQLFKAAIDLANGMTQHDEGKWFYTPESDEDPTMISENIAIILDGDGPIRKMSVSLADGGKLGSALLSYDGLNEEKARRDDTCDAIDDVLQTNDIKIRELKDQLYDMEVDKVNIATANQEMVKELMTKVKVLTTQVHVLQQDNATLTTVQSQSALARDYADASEAAKEAAEMAAALQAVITLQMADDAKFAAGLDAEDAKFAAGLDAEDAKNAVVATTTKAAKKDKYAAFAGLFESMVDQANEDKDSAGPGHHVIEQTVTTRKVRITRDPESGVTTKVTDMDAGVLHGEKIGDTDSLTFVTRFGEGQAPERDERAYHARKHVGTENLANTFLSGKVRKEITMNSFD